MPVQITNLSGTLWTGLNSGFSKFMNFIPSFLGAVIILVAGWYVSKIVGRIIERLLVASKLDLVAQKANVGEYLPRSNKGARLGLSYLVGSLAKWFIFLVFIQAAANTLGIIQISAIINDTMLFIPNILVAGALIVFGSWASRYFANTVSKSSASISPLIVRYGIMGFAVIAAVSQLGVATNLINILFTGLVTSLALAFGLAFGLGGQSTARDITQNLMGKSRSLTEVPRVRESDSSEKDFSH